ncbi:MAG: hypothetical protein LBV32_08685 [Tannerellaceae bacterium]|jgi:hypothetical protein|nr:hypothetical protein [Tannerellaceae bacterium]
MDRNLFPTWILIVSTCLVFYSCSTKKDFKLPNLEIREGKAILSGKMTNFNPSGIPKPRRLSLSVPHPFTEEWSYMLKTEVDSSGFFSFEVPLQSYHAIGHISPDFRNYDDFDVCLTVGEETKIDVVYQEKTGTIKNIDQINNMGLTSVDLIKMDSIQEEVRRFIFPDLRELHRAPARFVKQSKVHLADMLKELEKDTILSEVAKKYSEIELKLLMLNQRLLLYKIIMRSDFSENGEPKIVESPHIDKHYYTFLKDFKLNDPQYLYSGVYYSNVALHIISDEIFNIPPIDATPIDQWLKIVKNSTAELLGFDEGLFYDLLAANSYAQQFNQGKTPLSDIQKENINNYFKDGKAEIAKIILKKNEEISKLEKDK